MSTHAIEIVEIQDVLPHPNPESTRMEITNIWGWQCCIGKGQFKKGDKAVYIPPDYCVKTNRPEFSFLYKEGRPKERITVRRFKGSMSQGLLIQVPAEFAELPVGTDLMEKLDIERYEPPLPKSTYGNYVSAPSGLYCPKFDVESFQRYVSVFQPGEEVIATEKIHGCFHGQTRVMLANGEERPISSILPGDKVLSFDESQNKFVISTVLRTIKQSNAGKWIKLNFGNREIICTIDHRFLTKRGWIEAENITFDDEIISFN